MEYWGEIKLIKISSANDFWCLIDELCDDNSKFMCNRSTILQAYKDGNLYGLEVEETDEMYNNYSGNDDLFCRYSFYLLPCFCVKEDDKAIIIWTHTRARRRGFGKKLVKLLKLEYAYKPLPESFDFWNKCGIKYCE